MNFGPLNKQGGWRRLNVAITRARYRNEIVSSIRASDIPESVTTEGLRHLRRYLDYAARGLPALALDTSAGGDAESPFEESVITVIRSWGYDLTPQVGTAGYRIDIGVRHPDHPGVYASASNATATGTTPPKSPVTATGSASKSSAASAGTSTESGAPPGTGTVTAKNASSATPSNMPSRHQFTGCSLTPPSHARTRARPSRPRLPPSTRPRPGRRPISSRRSRAYRTGSIPASAAVTPAWPRESATSS
jgi:hypothetical protein